MARGPRKTIEDKIRDKEELIASLKVRIQSEEKELAELRREKRMKELEAITEFLDDTGISVEEARAVLERHALEMQEQSLEDENQESELSEVS
ncbi:MAG: hypothetical protein ACI4SE_03605 [Lachnospiraceae bacterium]